MIRTPKYSFIEFSTQAENCDCNFLFEIADLSDLCFPIEVIATNSQNTLNKVSVYLSTLHGDVLTKIKDYYNASPQFYQWLLFDINISHYLACKDCFRIAIQVNDAVTYYSNAIRYNSDTTHLLVSFKSRISTYFPFTTFLYYSLRLPFELANQTPKTQKQEYVDANGYIHNPFKSIRDTYTLNVDYLSLSLHKKIQIMLMHDVVINDVLINETGEYQIDYKESIFLNKKNLYKASTQISEQSLLLMRNY